jgi:gliding motility-associated lipoprotein GldH
MRFVVLFMIVLLAACDNSRVFEKNSDFEERFWLVQDKPTFDFEIQDTTQAYTLYCNIRNSVSYPYSRIFVSYSLKDSFGNEMSKQLVSTFLFDQKTGEPLGTSGLGDIYDQQLPLLANYTFPKPGKYTLQFEQFMRTDTLQGVLAVGLRVENKKE